MIKYLEITMSLDAGGGGRIDKDREMPIRNENRTRMKQKGSDNNVE